MFTDDDNNFVHGESVLERLKGLPKPALWVEPPVRQVSGCVRFTVGSGGAPEIPAPLELVEGREIAKYPTVRNGWAYGWEGYIRCTETSDGVYTTPEGVNFRWVYRKGDPESFDAGWFDVINAN